MKHFLRMAGFASLLVLAASTAYAANKANDAFVSSDDEKPAEPAMVLPERALGKADAPIKVDEYISLTCSHCAEFYNAILPELEKRYIDTGKVRFVLHDFVRNAVDLKAAVLARCMPEDEFFPFIKILYTNQDSWAFGNEPEKILLSYAKLGGLSEEKAQACLKDTKLQDAVVAENVSVQDKVEATPTFIINDGADKISGALPVPEFAKVFDRLLAASK